MDQACRTCASKGLRVWHEVNFKEIKSVDKIESYEILWVMYNLGLLLLGSIIKDDACS